MNCAGKKAVSVDRQRIEGASSHLDEPTDAKQSDPEYDDATQERQSGCNLRCRVLSAAGRGLNLVDHSGDL